MAQERDEYIAKLEQAQQELVETKNKITEVETSFQEVNVERLAVGVTMEACFASANTHLTFWIYSSWSN